MKLLMKWEEKTNSYKIEEGFPHVVNDSRKLLDLVLALQSAVGNRVSGEAEPLNCQILLQTKKKTKQFFNGLC